ncbi:MAG TPA: hypothetical protein VK988_13305 [Acidimicrobiales bacterium]|nr:hypothetical protein [Acidimicrobiales bacterium]
MIPRNIAGSPVATPASGECPRILVRVHGVLMPTATGEVHPPRARPVT